MAKIWDNYALADARRRAELKQSEVAEKVGISAQWLSMVEKGRKLPSNDLVERLAALYNRKTADFFIAR